MTFIGAMLTSELNHVRPGRTVRSPVGGQVNVQACSRRITFSARLFDLEVASVGKGIVMKAPSMKIEKSQCSSIESEIADSIAMKSQSLPVVGSHASGTHVGHLMK